MYFRTLTKTLILLKVEIIQFKVSVKHVSRIGHKNLHTQTGIMDKVIASDNIFILVQAAFKEILAKNSSDINDLDKHKR